MRFSIASVVLVAAATTAAVSAGSYPVKTGGGKGGAGNAKGGKGGGGAAETDDRFHFQSDDGQYVYGHTSGNQGRAEVRDKDGTVTGYYSYVDGNGKLVYVNYVADKNGYRVLSNTGAPSASVTIEGGAKSNDKDAEKDFQQVFSDFAKRIKGKVVSKPGQEAVDPFGDGQHEIVVDPSVVSPTKETKPASHDETNQFPDWNQVEISSTRKPTDGAKLDEGQQQQETVDPNWDGATTQKPNTKGHDNEGQESDDNGLNFAVTTTEKSSKPAVPLYPVEPQGPTRGDQKGEYPDATTVREYVQETTVESVDYKSTTESIAVTEYNSPVTKPASTASDAQTTISYYDDDDATKRPATKGGAIGQTTVAVGTEQYEESSTATVSESSTQYNGQTVVVEDGVKTKTTDAPVSDVDYTTVETKAPAYESDEKTTFQPEIKVGDVETTTGIQYVTEANKDDFDFRTLEPTDVIGTTVNPGQSEVTEQEITWPEISQGPTAAVPQVLVPLNPYAENSGVKTSAVKSQPADSRPKTVGDFDAAVNALESVTATANGLQIGGDTTLYPNYFVVA